MRMLKYLASILSHADKMREYNDFFSHMPAFWHYLV